MMKIAASVLGGALTVGGAGYSYVTSVQNENSALKAEKAALELKNGSQASKIAGMGLAIDDAIRELQTVREKETGK